MNAVQEARDRWNGRLQSYDENAHAPWRVLREAGLVDLWRRKLPDLDAQSFGGWMGGPRRAGATRAVSGA